MPAPRRRLLLVLALLLVGAAAAVFAATHLPLGTWAETARATLEGWGPWGPVGFALGYALAVVCLVPGSPLAVLAGAAFGLPVAVAAVYVGALLGSSAALLLARGTLRPRVAGWLAGHPRLLALDRLMGERGTAVTFLLRLTPALPFTLLNYALGLTRLSLGASLAASPAMLPGIALYASLGAAAGAAVAGAPQGWGPVALLALGILAAIVVSVWLARVAQRALPPGS